LPEVFQKLQRSLNEYTGYRLDILTSLLEPFLIIFVAALMVLLLAGVAVPLYDLVNTAL
jgi:type II secretory pathway component PulF